MNKILNILFSIMIWFFLSILYLSYNNLIDINQEINKKTQQVKKIKTNIRKINKEIQKKNKAIGEITKEFSSIKQQTQIKKIRNIYYLIINKKFNSNFNLAYFKNSWIRKWKEKLFYNNIKTSYKKDIIKIYKISWNKFSLFTWNIEDIFWQINNINNKDLIKSFIININFNYGINKDRIFEMLKTIYRSYNIRFIASNYQQLFTYLKNVNISYNANNKLEILNIIDIINKYKILFNNEEEQKIQNKLKTILYNIMK